MSARFLLVLACTAALPALAQQNDVPLERDIYYDIDRNGACRTSTVHTGLRPIIESRADLENVMGFRPDSTRQYYLLTTKLFKEHLIQVKSGDFRVTIDPAFRFEMGKDFVETSVANNNSAQNSYNSRGFWIKADLGRTVSFQTGFYENLSIVPLYLYTYVQGSGVVPGQGRVKGFGERGLDFAWSYGNVSWSPKRWLNVQFGNGRHFVGNGYRSVLLSDNTFPYPYFKLSAITTDQRCHNHDHLPTGRDLASRCAGLGDRRDRPRRARRNRSAYQWWQWPDQIVWRASLCLCNVWRRPQRTGRAQRR